jgi:hypothetical protein
VENGFYLALGTTLLLPFLQYPKPVLPKSVAWAGVIGRISVMATEALSPDGL